MYVAPAMQMAFKIHGIGDIWFIENVLRIPESCLVFF